MASSNVSYDPLKQIGAWIVLAVILTGAAQFDTTAKLAAAFAYLVLVMAAMYYGPEALVNINTLINSTTNATPPKQTSPVTTPGGGTGQHPVNKTGPGV